jgi:hypothetical protein
MAIFRLKMTLAVATAAALTVLTLNYQTIQFGAFLLGYDGYHVVKLLIK